MVYLTEQETEKLKQAIQALNAVAETLTKSGEHILSGAAVSGISCIRYLAARLTEPPGGKRKKNA